MITVACVLRSGGIYTDEWVARLSAGVDRHLPLPYRFVCLTDMAVALPGVEIVRLPRPAPSTWWAKMCLFAPGLLEGRVLYFDLDSVVVGDLSDLAMYDGAFSMIGDFYAPQKSQSGIMAWLADTPTTWALYARFQDERPEQDPRFHGDGDFIAHVMGGREDRLDRLYPGQIVSFKRQCRGGVPTGARAVAFHGSPKMHQLSPTHPLSLEWRGECPIS